MKEVKGLSERLQGMENLIREDMDCWLDHVLLSYKVTSCPDQINKAKYPAVLKRCLVFSTLGKISRKIFGNILGNIFRMLFGTIESPPCSKEDRYQNRGRPDP